MMGNSQLYAYKWGRSKLGGIPELWLAIPAGIIIALLLALPAILPYNMSLLNSIGLLLLTGCFVAPATTIIVWLLTVNYGTLPLTQARQLSHPDSGITEARWSDFTSTKGAHRAFEFAGLYLLVIYIAPPLMEWITGGPTWSNSGVWIVEALALICFITASIRNSRKNLKNIDR